MLKKANRFTGRFAISRIYKKGQSVRSPYITVKFVPRNKLKTAVVVSGKVTKSAPTRNKIRRRIYEIIRNNHSDSAMHMVFTVFDARVADMPQAELEQTLASLVDKAQRKA